MNVIKGYKIQGILAKGGMATIYIAMQESLQRQVALKILDPKLDATVLDLFLDESRIIASLKHPNIVPVIDVGRVGIHFYHAMEYLEGGDLEVRIAQGIEKNTALEIVLELADALYLVHSKGIIHGDIKPANIVFRSDDCPVLTDFGISKRTNIS
ncbi:MAG: serine/threonine protein kinase, partial [Gammaproteobacteria bacterium]|nr:serine/threonine protein kinase [Gammaproteobacteria bacterium]